MPFGLVNSVAIFINFVDHILGSELLEFTIMNVDDIVVASRTWEKYWERVDKVLLQLSEHSNKIKFLGFIASDLGISANPTK